jgi:hypothetical protein
MRGPTVPQRLDVMSTRGQSTYCTDFYVRTRYVYAWESKRVSEIVDAHNFDKSKCIGFGDD